MAAFIISFSLSVVAFYTSLLSLTTRRLAVDSRIIFAWFLVSFIDILAVSQFQSILGTSAASVANTIIYSISPLSLVVIIAYPFAQVIRLKVPNVAKTWILYIPIVSIALISVFVILGIVFHHQPTSIVAIHSAIVIITLVVAIILGKFLCQISSGSLNMSLVITKTNSSISSELKLGERPPKPSDPEPILINPGLFPRKSTRSDIILSILTISAFILISSSCSLITSIVLGQDIYKIVFNITAPLFRVSQIGFTIVGSSILWVLEGKEDLEMVGKKRYKEMVISLPRPPRHVDLLSNKFIVMQPTPIQKPRPISIVGGPRIQPWNTHSSIYTRRHSFSFESVCDITRAARLELEDEELLVKINNY